MPIVSRVITASQTTSDGTVRCNALITDGLGRTIRVRGIRAANEAAGQNLIDVLDFTSRLKQRDFDELLNFVGAGGDPATWDLTGREITRTEGLDFLVTYFATHDGASAIRIAVWLSGLSGATLVAIRNRLGLSVAVGNRLKARADLMAACAATFDQVEVV